MQDCRPYSCYKVVKQEFLAAPDIFQYGPEEKKRVHVKEYMYETAMHEHVGKELVWLEKL